MRLLFALSLVLVVVVAGCASTPSQIVNGVKATGVKHEIDITSIGFSPRLNNIGLGDTVDFVNKDTAQHWPASDIHPTHNIYPEKGGCTGSKFDACHGLAQGETYEFIFFYKGSWCFHDHLNTNLVGCVDVQ